MNEIAVIAFAVIVLALLYYEFSAEKITRDERGALAVKLSAFADEMEYAELIITPDHIRELVRDLEGDLS